MITRSTRQPTDSERLAAYLSNPAAIERRTFRVWDWQRQKIQPHPKFRREAHSGSQDRTPIRVLRRSGPHSPVA